MSNEQMRIGEFAAAAGVSARTVRYYIVEGLMPPPEGTGLGAMYGQAHLDRLQLILRLKDAYLPLKEIRRQLTGLDDTEVRRHLKALKEMDNATTKARSRTAPRTRPGTATHAVREDSAADYLQRIARADGPIAPPDVMSPVGLTAYSPVEQDSQNNDWESWPAEPSLAPNAPTSPGQMPPPSPLTVGQAVPMVLPPNPPSQQDEPYDPTETAENWVRLRIGDDVELLVRSGAYHRLRDRIDWLTGWARAIFR